MPPMIDMCHKVAEKESVEFQAKVCVGSVCEVFICFSRVCRVETFFVVCSWNVKDNL